MRRDPARLRRQRRRVAEHLQHHAGRRATNTRSRSTVQLGRELRPARPAEWSEHPARRPTSAPQSVTFFYDHKTHWVTDNVSSIIATVPGSFQSEMGCTGDWDPACFRTWLQDVNDTSIYSFSTGAIPAGSYEAKVALNGSWDVNYGQGGVQNGTEHRVHRARRLAWKSTFQWNSVTKELRVDRRRHPWRPHQGAGVLAVGRHDRLERSHRHRGHPVRGSGRRADARWSRRRRRARTRGVWTLTHDPAGLSAAHAREISAPREPRGVQAAARCRRGRRAKA